MHPGIFAATTPDKAAIIMGGSGETVTYAELDERSNRVSQLFAALGLAAGDHVAFQVGNRPVFFDLLWGAHRAGLVYTALSTRLAADETAYIVGNCDAAVVVADAAQTDTLAALAPSAAGAGLDTLRSRYVIGGAAPGWDSWEEAVGAQPARPLDAVVAGDDMLYSSGTTGRPKGVYRELGDATLADADLVTLMCQLLFGFSDETVYLSPAPLYHAAPLRFTRSVHRSGGTVIVMEHFDAAGCLDLLGRYRVTHTQVVPTMFIRMLKLPAEVRARADLSSLRVAIHAAAPCPVPVKQQMIEWWGPIIWEYYAGTEGNGLVLCSSEEWLAHPGTVGRAVSGEVHIVGDDGAELPRGRSGTVYFGGGSDFVYHRDPAKTAEAHSPEGWGTLGDVGYLDEDGYVFLTDRKANMIISGGVNIYPQETENLLAMHPKVGDVAVFGVPDDEMGEQVKAVVEPVDRSDAGPALEAELIAYCRARLSHLKCPQSVDFVAQLPRHPTGKLYKRLLRDPYWEGHATRI
jgi:long-chain acyl-CoA synthetase